MNKIALITGATAGIGKATALLLANNNYNVIVTGRRKNLLNDLKEEIVNKTSVNVLALNFDIRNRNEVENAIDQIPKNWKKIDVLINNAGLASGLNNIQDGDIEDWEKMIEQKKGHIVNIGSVAGKEVYPFGNVYCSTKHAVDAITKAMRMDLLEYGIKVTSINPGMVETEFSIVRLHGDTKRAKTIYKGFEPLHAEDIAETVLFAISRPAHVNINDLIILPTAQANSSMIYKN